VHAQGKGDLLVKIFVETPTKLTGRQKELLEELRQTEIRDLNFHLKYYRSLVNYINSIPESKIIEKSSG